MRLSLHLPQDFSAGDASASHHWLVVARPPGLVLRGPELAVRARYLRVQLKRWRDALPTTWALEKTPQAAGNEANSSVRGG